MTISRFLSVALVALSIVLVQGTWILAGTTGTLSGMVVVSDGTALAGATVTATSPSESVTATTDATGHFTFVSLIPDTYTVVVSKDGYATQSTPGVTVVADNTQSVTLTTEKSAKVLGTVAVRANGQLVKPGTTADVYSVNTRSSAKMATLGGGGGADNAYSALAALPGAYIPVGQSGWNQNVFIRGGDYDQVGYEYDGVPVNRSFDNYPAGTTSSLGQQQLQLYTGAAPANAESQGLAGFINQVIRTGTYPGYGAIDVAVGGPSLYNKLNLEVGGATPDRRFSYYVGVGGYNMRPRLVDQFNGASLQSTYGVPFSNTNTINNAVGVTPNGYVMAPYDIFQQQEVADRETVANVHIGLPHHNDSGRDDIQLLYSTSLLYTSFYSSAQDFGLPFMQANNGGPFVYLGGFQYNGHLGDTFTSGPVSHIATYQAPSSGVDPFTNIPSGTRDANQNGQGIGKIQYQHNIGSNAFLRIYGYSYYSWWFLAGHISSLQNFVAENPDDYELSTHSRGASVEFQDQVNSKNLVGVQASYTTATSLRDNNTQGLGAVSGTRQRFAVLVNAANPQNGICYNINGGSPIPSSCEPFAVGTSGTTFVKYPDAATGNYAPAPAGFEYLIAENGPYATYNTVTPKFGAVSLTDEYKASDKLLLNLGLRVDRFQFDGTDTTGGMRNFWFNAWNASQCVLRTPGNKPVDKSALPVPLDPTQPCSTEPALGGVSWIVPIFTNTSAPSYTYTETQPRLGGTYTLSADDVLRFSYGKFVQPPNAAFEQYNTSQQNLPATLGNTFNFYSFGFTTPGHELGPSISNNADFSWEHHFRNSDASFKLSPFIRKTKDQYEQFFLDQVTGFVSGFPIGNQTSEGIEFELSKGDFSANGLSGVLSYTYTHSYVTLNRLSNGGTVFSSINNAISKYNAYTSACSGNTTNPACGGGVDTNNQVTAACYTPGGVADASCAAGDIANPYWNAPMQSQYDVNARYLPFDIIPNGFNSTVTSYEVPHVASLILNYKHDKWAITPAVQFHAGQRYGAPLQSQGINPAIDPALGSTGCTALSGSTSGDPRYPFGAGGGAPYDASSCGGNLLIPDPFTGSFDQPGAFTQPSQILVHLQMTYEATPRLTLVASVLNLLNTCFGGSSEPWTAGASNKVCGYNLPSNGPIPYVGNFYNPTDSIQQLVKYPYMQGFGVNGLTNIDPSVPTTFGLEAKISL